MAYNGEDLVKFLKRANPKMAILEAKEENLPEEEQSKLTDEVQKPQGKEKQGGIKLSAKAKELAVRLKANRERKLKEQGIDITKLSIRAKKETENKTEAKPEAKPAEEQKPQGEEKKTQLSAKQLEIARRLKEAAEKAGRKRTDEGITNLSIRAREENEKRPSVETQNIDVEFLESIFNEKKKYKFAEVVDLFEETFGDMFSIDDIAKLYNSAKVKSRKKEFFGELDKDDTVFNIIQKVEDGTYKKSAKNDEKPLDNSENDINLDNNNEKREEAYNGEDLVKFLKRTNPKMAIWEAWEQNLPEEEQNKLTNEEMHCMTGTGNYGTLYIVTREDWKPTDPIEEQDYLMILELAKEEILENETGNTVSPTISELQWLVESHWGSDFPPRITNLPEPNDDWTITDYTFLNKYPEAKQRQMEVAKNHPKMWKKLDSVGNGAAVLHEILLS